MLLVSPEKYEWSILFTLHFELRWEKGQDLGGEEERERERESERETIENKDFFTRKWETKGCRNMEWINIKITQFFISFSKSGFLVFVLGQIKSGTSKMNQNQ